jgi:hypothetical protein
MSIEPRQQEGAEETPRGEGLLETAVSVVTQPVPTMRRLTSEPKIWWAVIVTLAIQVASALVVAAQPTPLPPVQPGLGTPPQFEQMEDAFRAFGVAFTILGPLFALVWLALVTGALQLAAYVLGGRGGYAGLFTALGLAQVPQLFGIPAQLLPLVAGTAGRSIAGLIGLVLSIWVLVLGTIAVRENHRFTTGRAVAAVLIPLAVVLSVLLFVVVLFAVLIASMLSGAS